MELLKYTVKRLLRNPYVLFWAIGFMIFWEVIGAYIQSKGVPAQYSQYYIASWYAIIALLASSAVAVSSTFMLNYQTGGLSHLFRFSRLSPLYYLLSIYSGITIVIMIVSGIMLATTYLLFGSKFGYDIALPRNIIAFAPVFILTGLFYTALSIDLNILSLKTTRKIGNVISFLPLIISYLFGFSYLYTNLGNIGLGSPFVNIAMLSYYAYMNQDPPLYLIGNVNSSISPVLPLIVLISWIGLLSVLALMFIRNLYLKPLEEGRSI